MFDAKNAPTLVNYSQLQAGTIQQQHALDQTLIDSKYYLVFVKGIDWFETNFMVANPSKFKIMFLGLHQTHEFLVVQMLSLSFTLDY